MLKRCLYAFGLLLIMVPNHLAMAQNSASAQIHALFTHTPVQLDGVLDDSIWQVAEKISDFTQRELQVGNKATERTEVAIAYTKDYLYVAVWCFDKDAKRLIAKEMKRDFSHIQDDNFMLIFDTYGDKRNGFMFVTNPNGARADMQIFNNGGSTNSSWNGVWDVKTKINNEGWFAEIQIPFSTLKYRTGVDVQNWGVNFERNIRRKREQVRWQGWSRDNKIEQVNKAGKLIGLDSLRNRKFIEFKPYAIGGIETIGGKSDRVQNIGGDINYLITPTYRLNVTLNTDFAQVESDRQIVNLTRFPVFFPERREFFLEGNDFFDFGFGGNRVIPFYSRKIGLNENRESVPILAGARLLGKENNHTLGIMSIQTASTKDQSSTQYTTASWRQDVGKQSVIGGMTTNKISDNRWHSTTGVNGRYSISNFLGNKNIDIGGAVIHTYNSDTSFNSQAFAYRFYLYYPNDRWTVIASTQRSPMEFNPEVGLMRRTNFFENFAMFEFKPRPLKRLKFIRQYYFQPAVLTLVNYEDTKKLQSFEYRFRYLGFETKNGEDVRLDYKRRAEGLSDSFAISTDVIIPKSTYWWNEWEASFRTFNGRTIYGRTALFWGDFYNGTRFRHSTELNWRTNKYMNVSLSYESNNIRLPNGRVNANLVAGRIEYAVNPNVFGSLFGQWNNSSHALNFNYRLQIIPKIGTDFYLIVNQLYDAQGSLKHMRTTVLGKLIWRFTT
jgi:Domain of unknown function (DUF5916)